MSDNVSDEKIRSEMELERLVGVNSTNSVKKRKVDALVELTNELFSTTNNIAKEMVSLAQQTQVEKDTVNQESIKKFDKTQKWAFDSAVTKRQSVCITGPAGTGKSFLYGLIYDFLSGMNLKVVRCATTGIAAVNIGGTTWHQWMGIGLATKSIDELVVKIEADKDLLEALTECDVLMIDEMSMCDPLYFAKCSKILGIIRKKPNKPFGGIQMIAFGDFLQLPAITEDVSTIDMDDDDDSRPYKQAKVAFKDRVPFTRPTVNRIEFVFELKLWGETFQETIELDTIFRQTDNKFRAILNRMRFGTLNADDIRILRTRVNAKLDNPIELRSFRKEVNELNHQHLMNIDSPIELFYSSRGYKWKDPSKQNKDLSAYQNGLLKRLAKDCPAPEFLKLKLGIRVMLLWNEDVEKGLVNGAQGEVIRFDDVCKPQYVGDERKFKIPIVRFDRDGLEHAVKPHRYMVQDRDVGDAFVFRTPLRPSAAVTIHKAQGLQFPKVRTRADESIFSFGQTYVAISRVTTLEGLSLLGFNPDHCRAHPKALVYYKRLTERKKQLLLLK